MKEMTKKEMIRKVRDVIEGNTAMQYAVFRRKGRRWHLVDWGLGIPLRENYPSDCLIFRHDRNECTIEEAKREVERELREG
jgi:Fe-S-cluster containining protein